MPNDKIKFLDPSFFWKEKWPALEPRIKEFLHTGQYIGGSVVENFESEFAKWSGADYCAGVGNGYDALKIALKALELKPGDRIIVPSNTFIATWLAVSDIGCEIVPVEPNWSTHVLGLEEIEAKICPRTKAVILVTLYGNAPDIGSIQRHLDIQGIKLVIDAAQSHGTKINNRPLGKFGDAIAYSFYPGKTLGAVGDAGAITVNCPDLYNKIKIIRNYGSNRKYVHDEIGCNSRLDPVQAIFLTEKLKFIDEEISIRKKQIHFYRSKLNREHVSMVENLDIVNVSWHLAVGVFKLRNKLLGYLNSINIETLIHYPIPCHAQSIYSEQFSDLNLKASLVNSNSIMSLPLGSHLKSDDLEKVTSKINRFYET